MGFLSGLKSRFFSLTESQRRSIAQTFGTFYANFFSIEGNAIITNSYQQNTEVYSLIKKIIDITKSVPWIVEQKMYDGSWKILKDTSVHELMSSPNVSKGYSWNDIEEQMLVFLLCTGNAYVYGETQFGYSLVEELDILPSPFIRIEANQDFFLPEYKYRFQLGTNNRVIDKAQIAHIKFIRPAYSSVRESLYGLSPIEVAARAIQVGNDRWEADANLLQNRGAIGMVTDKSAKPMTADDAKIAQEAFQERVAGPSKFGKIIVTNKDLNYIQMAMSSADLQLIEKGVVNLRSLCNVFGLDSSLFNDPENKTYSNRTEAEKSMFTNAIMPISDRIAEQLTRFICYNHFPNKRVRMRQDFSKIECLQENFKEKSSTLSDLKIKGIYTANEVREKLGDKKSDDENADKLIITSSSTLVADLGGQQPTNQPTGAAPII